MNQTIIDSPAAQTGRSIEQAKYQSHCPYLGHKIDRFTIMSDPDHDNRCYRHNDASTVSLRLQKARCISPNYAECDIFQEPEQEPISKKRFRLPGRRSRMLALIIVVVLIALAAFSWWPEPVRSILEAVPFSAMLDEPTPQIAEPTPEFATIVEPPITSPGSFTEYLFSTATPSFTSDSQPGFNIISYGDGDQ